jgi:hypothetical protein
MKKMCKECPWRKNAPAGWLGDAAPEEFVHLIRRDVKLPCHAKIDYDDEDWQSNIEDAPYCAGALLATRKMCKLPRNPEHAKMVKEVEDNPNHMNHAEFTEHHNSATYKSWE